MIRFQYIAIAPSAKAIDTLLRAVQKVVDSVTVEIIDADRNLVCFSMPESKENRRLWHTVWKGSLASWQFVACGSEVCDGWVAHETVKVAMKAREAALAPATTKTAKTVAVTPDL